MIGKILLFISKTFVFHCVIFILLHQYVFAQKEQPAWGIESKLHYGFLVPHHDYMLIMSERHYSVLQFNLFKSGNHNNEWNTLYDFPQYGISVIYSPLSSPQYLGNAFGILPFINFPLFQSQKCSFSFYTGAGIGYLTKKFDRIENYRNHAIGSHLNAALMGQFDFRVLITDNIELSSGLSVLHFSNGKISVPNLGINTVSSYIGCAYHIPIETEKTSEKLHEQFKEKKWEHSVFFGMAIKQLYPVGGGYYPASSLSYNIKQVRNKKRKIGLGMDLFYDYTDRESFIRKGFDKSDITYLKQGIYLAHDYRLGKMSIILHLGTYLYAFEKNQGVGMIYDRVGVQYYFNERLSAHVALKTHYAKADFIEWAINIVL
jgi:hypothetical protein